MTHELTITDSKFTATRNGLAVTGAPTLAEWAAYGEKLAAVEGAIQWVVGDWLNYGEMAYGELSSQALTAGASAQTWMNCKWVASRFEISRRREGLSFGHHAAVAGLDRDEQDQILTAAEEGKSSVSRVRQVVAEYRRGVAALEPLQTGEASALVSRAGSITATATEEFDDYIERGEAGRFNPEALRKYMTLRDEPRDQEITIHVRKSTLQKLKAKAKYRGQTVEEYILDEQRVDPDPFPPSAGFKNRSIPVTEPLNAPGYPPIPAWGEATDEEEAGMIAGTRPDLLAAIERGKEQQRLLSEFLAEETHAEYAAAMSAPGSLRYRRAIKYAARRMEGA